MKLREHLYKVKCLMEAGAINLDTEIKIGFSTARRPATKTIVYHPQETIGQRARGIKNKVELHIL